MSVLSTFSYTIPQVISTLKINIIEWVINETRQGSNIHIEVKSDIYTDQNVH